MPRRLVDSKNQYVLSGSIRCGEPYSNLRVIVPVLNNWGSVNFIIIVFIGELLNCTPAHFAEYTNPAT